MQRQSQIQIGATRPRQLISLTPLIDVVFILLVFFMLASSFLDWRSISLDTVNAPSQSRQSTEHRVWILQVTDDKLTLDDVPASLDEVIVQLQQGLALEPDGKLIIQPINQTPLQAVVNVLDRLNSENIEQFTLVRDRQWQVDTAAAAEGR